MPDLRPLRQAEQQIADTEERAIADARQVYAALRTRLGDLLLGSSVSTLPLQLRTVFQEARTQIQSVAQSVATVVATQANTYAGDELDRLAQLLGYAPGVRVSAIQLQSLLRDALIAESLLWLGGIEGAMTAEAIQLQLGQAEPHLIQQRLIADTTPVGERASVWRSGLVPLEAAIVGLVWGQWNGSRQLVYQAAQRQSPLGVVYRRQAIAAIDKRTTQCCLNVHGQIVTMDAPFKLTGTPRYGSELMWPPFHWRCRTSIVLYHEAMERVGPTTEALRAAARSEQATRGGA